MTIKSGDLVAFTLDSSISSHPFWIKRANSTGTTDRVLAKFVKNNGANSGEIILDTYELVPGTYHYNCQYHSGMHGTITVEDPVVNLDGEDGIGTNASLFGTSDGDASNAFDAFVNIPMIDDVWAVRGVFYRSQLGGYIDNVPGTLALSPNNPSYPGASSTYTTIDNSSLVEDNFNDSSYEGFRLSSAMTLNENWDLLITHIDQEISADGVFDYDPAVGEKDSSLIL